eukprot:CAMPEP_0170102732 /NCGR_PEP_ID=MMETSP0020_2-20130122/3057_1 /TAXON_ID=98059 /ORGANISM="Dinobryon sp., Strain UTEXLB2267" /LENGTH=1386 /DNA_ID=CAMNT_0010326131 /DNA_START=159 /DNA_END=4316 /DNA_ORIENTATION=+
MDEDLPLEYQFGYFSFGNKLIIQLKSELAVVSSILPSGLEKHFTNTTLEVFDSFSASTFRTIGVTLQPIDAATTARYIESIVFSSMSSSAINVVGTILNAVNCSGVTNCDKLKRYDCADMDFSCGSCMEGFIGESGSKNSVCVPSASEATKLVYICKSDSDCGIFQYCNRTGSCTKMSKKCPNSCSNQGVCTFINSNTGFLVSQCEMLSSDCLAVCQCFIGFGGNYCALSSAQLLQKIKLRKQMISSFNNQSMTSTSQNVLSRASTLLSITQKVDELDPDTVGPVLSAAGNILQSASVIGVGYEKLGGVLQSVDNIASVSSGSVSMYFLNQILTQYTSIAASQLFPQQKAVENVLSNIRSSTICIEGSQPAVHFSVPKSANEFLLAADKLKSVVTLSYNTTSQYTGPLRVSLIEVSAKHLEISNHTVLSNPLTIQVSGIKKANLSAYAPSFIAIIQNIVVLPFPIQDTFTTECNSRFFLSPIIVNYTCSDSGRILFHNCTNRIGILRSYCPTYKPSCKEISKNGQYLSSSCVLLNSTLTETICECKVTTTTASEKRSRNLVNEVVSIAGESGAMQFVAISEFVTADFLNTFTAAPSLTSSESVGKVVTVILMYAAVWMFALFIIASSYWSVRKSKLQNKKVATLFRHERRAAEVSQSTAAVCEYLSKYIMHLIPTVFRGTSSVRQCVAEIAKFHRYYAFFQTSNPRHDLNKRIMTALELSSTQCMLFFLFALFYHLQSTADDHTCLQWQSEQSCLLRKTPLDPYQPYCAWSIDKGCTYQIPLFTARMILAMTMLVSVITAIFLRPIGYLFELLAAPTTDLINTNVVDNGNSWVKRENITQLINKNSDAILNNSTRKIIGIETHFVPFDANKAQELAHVSGALVTTRAISRLHNDHLNVSAVLFKLRLEDHYVADCEDYEVRSSASSDDFASFSLSIARSYQDVIDAAHNSVGITQQFVELIYLQRRVLKSTKSRVEFDRQWGIDSSASDACIGQVHFLPHTQDKVFGAINNVTMLAERKIEMLKLASDKLTGIEIIHLFIMDLLGRHTAAAKIFEQIVKEDFKRINVVTVCAKYIAGVLLILMNVLFAYYSVLFGFMQGIAWQRQYVFACVVQTIVEVFINETLEVAWMHFFVPSIVESAEMRNVKTIIEGIIAQLCDFSSCQSTKDSIPVLINSPEYLFVSTKVAKSFPHLMESILVRTFTTHLPGEVSKLWMDRFWWSDIQLKAGSIRTRRGIHILHIATSVTLILAVTSIKNLIGAAPYELQRMVVRFLQPFFLSGIILLYSIVVGSTVNISLFFGILCLVIVYVVVQYIKDGVTIQNQLQLVRPIHTKDDVEFANIDPIIDFTGKASISRDSVEESVDGIDDDSSVRPDSINVSSCSSSDDW